MNSPEPNSYKVNGKQLLYDDICSDFDINNWPISTRKHSQESLPYVYFKTGSSSTSFLTNNIFLVSLKAA